MVVVSCRRLLLALGQSLCILLDSLQGFESLESFLSRCGTKTVGAVLRFFFFKRATMIVNKLEKGRTVKISKYISSIFLVQHLESHIWCKHTYKYKTKSDIVITMQLLN